MHESPTDEKLQAIVCLLLDAVDERLEVVRRHQVVLEDALTVAYEHLADVSGRLARAEHEVGRLRGEIATRPDARQEAHGEAHGAASEVVVTFDTVDTVDDPMTMPDRAPEVLPRRRRKDVANRTVASVPSTRSTAAPVAAPVAGPAIPAPVFSVPDGLVDEPQRFSVESFAAQLDVRFADVFQTA
jgi:hypothetical protein